MSSVRSRYAGGVSSWRFYDLTEYVFGHDGMWHVTRHDGTCVCGMGRASPLQYRDDDEAFTQCLDCLVRLWRRTAA
jgi:hypothetical protein